MKKRNSGLAIQVALAAVFSLSFLFIPVSSDGSLKFPLYASEYAQGYSDRVQLDTTPDFNRLADAVYLAEGGAKAKVPYGIFYKGCSKQTPDYCRRIAINTFKSAYKRFSSTNSSLPFIEYLAASYCPVGAKNDPSGLNKHWIKNVNYFLNQNKRGV